jgi:intraflagellar transport protein 172
MQKISSISWSPNSKKMAVATADRVVHLFNEDGLIKDKFSTRPAEKDNNSYIVISMAFSPDNQKLAVAQSDNIVFIYKLGVEWGEKKSIINKFAQNSAVTFMCWPKDRHNDLIFCLAEGKIKQGVLNSNKS